MTKEKKPKRAQKKSVKVRTPPERDLVNLLKHYQAGHFSDAEKMALSITEEYPDHQFGWKVLGAVLKQTGRVSESLAFIKKAVILDPNDTQAHYNLGNALLDLGKLEEAELSYNQAISLKLDFVEAHYNLGNTLRILGRLEEAEASYRKAIALKPDYAEAYYNFGITLHNLGRPGEAEASYRKAIALKPDYAEIYYNFGITLIELGRFEEAEASYRKAIALKPDYAEARYSLGLVFNAMGKYEEATEQFNLSNLKKSKIQLLNCLYLQDKKSLFFNQLDSFIDHGEINPVIGSLGCRSALSYGIERQNLFCKEPLKYVLETDLKKQHDFEKIFIKPSLTVLNNNRVEYRSTGLLTNGYQTSGNLFDIEPDVTEEIQKIIRSEVDKYRFNFRDSDEGLIKNWPADYIISGWLINMKNGGELRPHMHEEGWLSGSIYINVPPKLKTNSGNLVVCIEDKKFLKKGSKDPKSIIDVVTGSLVLFPSSLLHYTIPFQSEKERIVLAFDVVPK